MNTEEALKAAHEMEDEWITDSLSGILKIRPGDHTIIITGAPEQIDSKYGKDKKQYAFPAELDGISGTLIPPKRLRSVIAMSYKHQGRWPIRLEVRRIGEGMATEWVIISAPGAASDKIPGRV